MSSSRLHREPEHEARRHDIDGLRQAHHAVLSVCQDLECLIPDVTDISISRRRWTMKLHRAEVILRSIATGAGNLRSVLIQQFHEVLRRDPDLVELLPRSPLNTLNTTDPRVVVAWFQNIVEKIRVFTSLADLYWSHEVRSSRGEIYCPEERERKRVRVWEATLESSHDVVDLVPEAVFLIPDPYDATISKRAWERRMFFGRGCLRVLAEGDRREGHNMALRECADVLRRFPTLRDLLPDPADDMLSDLEWMRTYTRGVRALTHPGAV